MAKTPREWQVQSKYKRGLVESDHEVIPNEKCGLHCKAVTITISLPSISWYDPKQQEWSEAPPKEVSKPTQTMNTVGNEKGLRTPVTGDEN